MMNIRENTALGISVKEEYYCVLSIALCQVNKELNLAV